MIHNLLRTTIAAPNLTRMAWLLGVLCWLGFGTGVQAQVSIGGTPYTTLKGAFDAINAGTHTGVISIEVSDNTTETASAVLNASGSGAASYTAITISPSGGAMRTIAGLIVGLPLVDLNGADNVTINGLNTGGNGLTIENTATIATAGTSTIQFRADASNNTITNCSVLGAATIAQGVTTTTPTVIGGTIFFGTGTTTGNDNNTISNSKIGPSGTNLPARAIGSIGSATPALNSGNTINNCEIYDYFIANNQSTGIGIFANNETWSITNNDFYQTATRTQTTSAHHNMLHIASSAGNGFVITGNTFGYASGSATGTYTVVSNGTTPASALFRAVRIQALATTGTPTVVNNNTVSNISFSFYTSDSGGSAASFIALVNAAGLVGSYSNNTIKNIAISSNAASTAIVGFLGIYSFGTTVGPTTSNNNTIEDITVANTSSGGVDAQVLYYLTVGSTSVASFNTIQNITLTANTGTTGQFFGIRMTTSSSVVNVQNNTIRNLTSNVANTGTGSGSSVIGINITSIGAGSIIGQNTIHSLQNTHTTANTSVIGASISGSTATTIFERNFIHSINNTSTGTTASINGLSVSGGTTVYRNNMIRVGIDAAGADITNGLQVFGINETVGTNNFYNNTIYVGGSGVVGANSTFAFRSTVTVNTREYRNNIIMNARSNGAGTGKHYAIQVGGSAPNPAGLISNRNIFQATGTGAVFGLFNALDVANITDWNTATLQDVNSFDVNPLLSNPTGTAVTVDLHIPNGTTTPAESAATFLATVATDYDGQARQGHMGYAGTGFLPDIGADEFEGISTTPACNGAPAAGTVSASVTTACVPTALTVTLNGVVAAPGLSYQWQSSPDGSAWTNISGATNTSASVTATVTTHYRCLVTCANPTATSTPSSAVIVTINGATYASIPYTQNFESTWLSSPCIVAPLGQDIPDASWRMTSGADPDASWRADNTTTVLSGWVGTGGAYSPIAQNGLRSARFHSFNTSPAGTQGTLDLYVNLSLAGSKQLSFWYITPSTGIDQLEVLLSEDGGATFAPLTTTPAMATPATAVTTWTNVTATLISTSPTAIIRFRATGDGGSFDIGLDNVVVTPPCNGTPTAGTTTASVNTVCAPSTVTLSLSGATSAPGISYQWQSSPDGMAWSNIVSATNSTASVTVSSATQYRCIVTCANPTPSSANSTPVAVAYSGATYATVPYVQTFESAWINSPCIIAPLGQDTPDASWRMTQGAGDNDAGWRADNTTTVLSGWSSVSGAYTPSGSQGSTRSARFHSYNVFPVGIQGFLDLYINLSVAGTKQLSFDYINPTSSSDRLEVLLSEDGGLTFASITTAPALVLGGVAVPTWTSVLATLTSTSSTAVIRFRATGDNGNDDIGLDNVRILEACSGTPVAGTVTSNTPVACSGANLTLTGFTQAAGITYQWQSSPDGSAWTNVSGATLTTLSIFPSANTFYQCLVTCTNSAQTAPSSSILITGVTAPVYATLPYQQSFESTWQTVCATSPLEQDAPDASSRNTAISGNNSWRADNTTTTLSGWNNTTGGTLLAPIDGTRYARFHSSGTTVGQQGALNFYLNLSATGTKQINFDYINLDGTDQLLVQLSTDGGLTFTTLGTFTTQTVWGTGTVTTTLTPATAIVRFLATGDAGTTDIGIDNIRVASACNAGVSAGTTVTTTPTVCMGGTAVILMTGATFGTSLSYQLQFSTDDITFSNLGTAITTGLGRQQFNITSITVPLYFRYVVTCTATSTVVNGNSVLVTPTPVVAYATLPYEQSFEGAWLTNCIPAEQTALGIGQESIPDGFWRTIPTSGNSSWRANNTTTALSGWTNITGAYSPAASAGSNSARFHSSTATAFTGSMDLYIDMSGNTAGNATLAFDLIDPDGTAGGDMLDVLVSNDGGATFTTVTGLTSLGTTAIANWTTFTVTFTNATANLTANAPNTVIRFRGTSTTSSSITDLGIDNVKVALPCSGPVVGGTTLSSSATYCPTIYLPISLSLTGSSIGQGITYQWQSSPDGSTWTDISGATSAGYIQTTALVATTHFRCTVTCTNGGSVDFSTPVEVMPTNTVVTTYPYLENFDGVAANSVTSTSATTPTPATNPTNMRVPCGWSVLNVNNDTRSWENQQLNPASPTNALRYTYNSGGAANDWAFTPALTMTVGKSYILTFKQRIESATFPEGLEVRWGNAQNAAAMLVGNTIFNDANLLNVTYITRTATAITPTATGTYHIGFWAKSISNQFNIYLDDIQVVEVCAPATITTATLPNATLNGAYSQTLTTDLVGTPTWSVSVGSLPAGLSLNASTGTMSGTPTVAGSFNFTVAVSSSTGCSATPRAYTFVIDCPTSNITTASFPNGTINTVYTTTTLAQTGLVSPTWSISVGALPTGLTLDAVTGGVSGTPTALGTFNFTVQAQQSTCTVTKAFSIDIACPTLVFTNATASNGVVGTAYTLNVGVTGETATLTYSISPALPAGLTLDTATGAISGTPTTATASTTYMVTASQAGPCSVMQAYNFAIVCPTITFVNTTATSATVGVAYSIDASVTGNTTTVTYNVSPALPAGLTLNTSTGQITGTPTASVASTAYTVTASQSGPCSATQVYTFAVSCPTITFVNTTASAGTVGMAYSLSAQVIGNTTSITYSVSPALPAGLTLDTATGLISGTPTDVTASATYTVTATQTGCSATQAYTFAVNCPTITFVNMTASAGTVGVAYSLNASVTGNTTAITYSVSPALPAGLTLNTSTGQITGTPTTATASATYTVTASQAGPCSVTQAYTFAIGCPALTFNSTTATNATVGTAYSINAGVTGTALTVTYSVSPALPAGLSLNTATGAITGTPTTVTSSATYTVTATHSVSCTATQAYTFEVGCPTITMLPATLPDAIVNTPYSQTLSVTGLAGTYTWALTAGTMPTGLTLNAATGEISGTPTVLSTNNVTFTATHTSGCAVTLLYALDVVNLPTFTTQPVDASVCPNTTATFTVVVSSFDPATVQWEEKIGAGAFTPLTNVAPYSGVATNTLTISSATVVMSGRQYRCVATNPSGTTISNVVTLTSTDLVNPVLTVPANITFNASAGNVANCGQIVTFTLPTATDNCTASGSIVINQTTGLASGSTFPLGVTTVTFTATDQQGNVDTKNFTVTVVDNVQPTVITQNISKVLGVGNTVSITAAEINNGSTDNCLGTLTYSVSPNTFNCTNLGANTVTLTVTDANGNTNTNTATVTVTENVAPVLTLPANITVNTDANLCSAVVNYTVSATDNCTASGSITLNRTAGLASGSAFPKGVTTVTYTATDASGNVSAPQSFTVTVNDAQLPALVACPANIVVNNAAGLNSAIVTYTAPTATDNCPGATVARIAGLASGSAFPVGVTTVTHEATDVDNNKISCSFTVTVNFVNATPSFTASTPATVLEDAGAQSTTNWATGNDNDEAVQTLSYEVANVSNAALFSVAPAISATGTLTYTPAPNANGTSTFDVRVNDNAGGTQVSAYQTFTITVTAVNDAPSFTASNPPAVNEDAGAQTVTGWVTGNSAGPANESTQTLSYGIGTIGTPSLFSVAPAVSATGTLTYTPAPNAFGTSTVQVRIIDNGGTANSGVDMSAFQTFTITVGNVNDAPSFTASTPPTVLEDAGAQSVANFVTTSSAGATNESAQVLSYEIGTIGTPSLFSVAPAVSATGTLTYTPAPNANGTSTFQVRIKDDGGVANGGIDVSAYQTFTITVTAVNDAPSFTVSNPPTVNEDAGAQTVTSLITTNSAGPADENTQTLSYEIGTISNPTLFSVAPAISTTGTLTYTPATDAFGTSTVQVRVRDNGGVANGGVDVSAFQTFTITVSDINDAPTFTAIANIPASLEDQAVNIPAFVTSRNAGSPNENLQILSYEMGTVSNPTLFSVSPTVSATGALTYTPAPNANGTSTFQVRIRDNGGVANGGIDVSAYQTFTINVTAVNDEPTLASIANVEQVAGSKVVVNLTGITPGGGADEASQTFTVTTVATSGASVVQLPTTPIVVSGGTATFEVTLLNPGDATIRVIVQDNGGVLNGGDDSVERIFTIKSNIQEVVFVPSIFSPNGDNKNDGFRVKAGRGAIETLKLEVFDDRGNRVFYSDVVDKILDEGWDGKYNTVDQPQGVYGWRLSGKFKDGREIKATDGVRNNVNTGNINLIRGTK